MKTDVALSNGVRCVSVRGLADSLSAPDFADFIDTIVTDSNKSLYWDMSELDAGIPAASAAVFIEAFARLRALHIGLVVLNCPQTLVNFLVKAGMESSISFVSTEQEALVAVFKRFEKKYDDSFFQLLIREGCITRQQLAEAHVQYDLSDGKTPIDEMMLEKGLITVEDIFRAMAQKKSFLGEILVDAGLITNNTLKNVLRIQKEKGGKLGDLLKSVGAISEREIYEALAIQYWKKIELTEDNSRPVSEYDLVGFLASNDYLIIQDAEERLIQRGGEVVPLLIEQLEREDARHHSSILRVLGEIGDYRAALPVSRFLSHNDITVKDEAYWALVKMSRRDLAPSATWRWGRWAKGHSASGEPVPPFETLSNKELRQRMKDVASGAVNLDEVYFEYEAGRVNWEGGKVNLFVGGDGQVFIKRNCRGEISLLSKTVEPEKVVDLIANLEKFDVISVKSSKSFGTIDEPRNAYTFRLSKTARKSVFYWATEMYGSLQLMNVENITRMLLNFLEL